MKYTLAGGCGGWVMMLGTGSKEQLCIRGAEEWETNAEGERTVVAASTA